MIDIELNDQYHNSDDGLKMTKQDQDDQWSVIEADQWVDLIDDEDVCPACNNDGRSDEFGLCEECGQ